MVEVSSALKLHCFPSKDSGFLSSFTSSDKGEYVVEYSKETPKRRRRKSRRGEEEQEMKAGK